MGNGGASGGSRCPTPFAFPFTPLGLSLFDIDPSRILSMLHHQTWLAEEALRNRGLITAPKDFPTHRYNPLSDLLAKEYHQNHLHAAATAELLSGGAATSSSSKPLPQQQQQTHRSTSQPPQQQQQYKQQTQQPPFNIRYPSPAVFFHHHQHQQQLQHKPKSTHQGTPSPHHQTATSTQSSRSDALLEELKRKSELSAQRDEDVTVIEINSLEENGRSESYPHASNSASSSSALLYKDSHSLVEQLLQRRRSSSSLLGLDAGLRSYSQLLLSTPTPSCTDTSSCKEKSSSSSTSSTPPPTSALLAQHQQLSQMLKSPSETSSTSLFSEPIEEETRCVVCNAHFPNVWLLEQHAALQHPHIGPGEDKPFICEQCGQSYRYRSAYAKHKEQNHRARLPADKLFTCDVCGMQFRYLKSFKKHRLNHALERLHGKKGVPGKHPAMAHLDQDVVTSSQETSMAMVAAAADESGEDLRINIKREQPDDDEEQQLREEEQDNTIDSAGMLIHHHFSDNHSSSATSAATSSGGEPNISSSDVIHSTNKRPRLLTTPHMETDPSYHHLQQHQQQQQQQIPPHLHGAAVATTHQHPAATASASINSLNSLNSITSLINAERIPSEQFLGLNPQEASILNFLRVDAAERQREKRPQTSRFACPFCGKCVRSKENLKLHVRKHTGERPFVCLFCGRAFGGKSDLTRHLRIHTGERPYHCESCGKCFARADYLSKHLTTHIHNAPR